MYYLMRNNTVIIKDSANIHMEKLRKITELLIGQPICLSRT